MAEVDSLDIKISAEVNKANASIEGLSKKIDRLSSALSGVNSRGLATLGAGVNKLANAVGNFSKNTKSADFSRLSRNLESIGNIDTSKFSELSAKVSQLSAAFNGIGTIDTSGISNIATSLSKLGGKNAIAGADNLLKVGDKLAQFVSQMNGIGSLTFDAKSLSDLISSISKLGGKTATEAAKNLPPISAQLQNFVRQLNNIGSLNFDTTNLSNLINGISRLGGKTTENAAGNIPKLANALNGLMITLSQAPQVSQNIIQMTNALANLAAQGAKTGTAANVLTRSINFLNNSSGQGQGKWKTLIGIFKGTSGYIGGAIKKVSGLSSAVKRLGGSELGASKMGKAFTDSILKIGIAVKSAEVLARKLWSSIESSFDYIEVLNYFDAAFGQVAANADLSSFEKMGYDSAESYYNSFAERAEQLTQKMSGFTIGKSGLLEATGAVSLGLDPSQLMNYQAMFGQMSSSMGITSETALKLSQALTEIGSDLASVKNMDFDKVWEDMASGLAGMSRTLDKYGVNIRNVNLQQKLNELGIEANITKLNQNDKALLRAIILLENTKYAWGDLADTINQPANQLRLIQANFQNLSRTIGNLFLPIVKTVLPYINAFVIALQRLFAWLGKLIGIDISGISNAVGEMDIGGILDQTDDLSDGLGDAKKKADKLNKSIRQFDELKVISMKEDDDGGGGAGGGIGGGLLDAAFEDAFSEYQKVWDEAFNNLENRAQGLADQIEKSFEQIKKIIEDFYVGNFFKAGDDTSILITDINNFLSNAIQGVDWEGIGTNFAKFFNGLFTPDLFESMGTLVSAGINSALRFLDSFGETFNFGSFGKSIGAGLNSSMANMDWDTALSAASTWGTGIGNTINNFLLETDFTKVGSTVGNLLNTAIQFVLNLGTKLDFKLFGSSIAKSVNGFFKSFDFEALGKTLNVWAVGILDAAEKAIKEIKWDKIGKKIGELIAKVKPGEIYGKLLKIIMDLPRIILDTLSSVIIETDWKEIALDLVTGVKKAFTEYDWAGLFKSAGKWIGGIFKLKFDIALAVAETISGAIGEAEEYFKEKIEECGGNIVLGVLKGIVDGLIGIGKWIIDNIFSPFLDGIKEAFGINSPSTKMAEIGGFLVEGLQKGIEDMWNGFISFIGGLPGKIKKGFGDMKEKFISTGSKVISGIKGGITNSWKTFKEFLGIKKSGISGVFDGMDVDMESVGSSVTSGITNGIKNTWSTITSWANKIKEAFEIKIDAPSIVTGGINNALGSVKMKASVPKVNIPNVKAYASGGFVDSYSIFTAGENGRAEMLGTVGGRTAVAGGEEITGIADAVYSTGQAEASLLQTAVRLLQIISEKEYGVTKGEIGKAARDYAKDYYNRTGKEAYAF